MDLDSIRERLIAAARSNRPSEAVPAGFERRTMRRISALALRDLWGDWARALWRAAAPCVGLAVVLVAWLVLSGLSYSHAPDLSQELENTVFAAASLDQPPDLPR